MADRSRYVYLKEVYNYLNDYFCDRIKNGITGPVVWNDIHQALKDIPAADVRPVVRGEWIDKGIRYSRKSEFSPLERHYSFECSHCRKEREWKSDFCPNCGADMRGEY